MQRKLSSTNWVVTVTEASSINQPGENGRDVVNDALEFNPAPGATQKGTRGPHPLAPLPSTQHAASPQPRLDVVSSEAWTLGYHSSAVAAQPDVLPLPSTQPAPLGYEAVVQGQFTENLPYRLIGAQDPFPGAHNTTPKMTAELAILSAERYDDGARSRTIRLTRKVSPTQEADDGSVPRKRARGPTKEDADGAEPENKRSRGRPRLETTDETPAERRRTQIRIAQRAYRSRKENAITTLEKKVQDLKDTNEEMSNAFLRLHDFALNQGLLDQIPEFGRQLQATTEKFLALARRSSEDDGGDDRQTKSQTRGSEEPIGTSDIASPSARDISKSPPVVDKLSSTVSKPLLPWGGYIISHEQSLEEQRLKEPPLADFSTTLSAAEPLDFEVITQPTFENASFPLALSLSDPGSPFQKFLEPSPYEGLPLPGTYSPFEVTFGRRLQRFALEQAYKLVNMSNPDPTIFAKVFGFCMIFEPIDKIKERLQNAMDKSNQESLNNWLFPFVNLGGAGTQFPSLTTSATASGPASPRSEEAIDPLQAYPPLTGSPHRMGNQGTLDPLRPKFDTGFSTGPFNEAITEVRDTRLDKKLRILLPGFEGNFYDCDETEMYLHQRGINIPAGAETVTAEVDLAAFTDDTAEALSPVGSTDATTGGLFGSDAPSRMSPGPGLRGLDGANAFASGQSLLGGASSDADSAMSGFLLPSNPYSSRATPTASGFGSGGLLAFAEVLGNAGRPSTRRMLTINVNTLIRELVRRATCLGRSPGFKQSDVNQSFWIAAGVMPSEEL